MTEFFDTIVRVRYAETDQMGFVYYGNYYIYFEIGRVEYMRHQGVNYKQMEIQDDSFIVVAESKCRYRRPARYDDLLRIRTRVTEFKHLTGQEHPKTSIVYEFPQAEGDPYYPIPRSENADIYRKYQDLANTAEGVHFEHAWLDPDARPSNCNLWRQYLMCGIACQGRHDSGL